MTATAAVITMAQLLAETHALIWVCRDCTVLATNGDTGDVTYKQYAAMTAGINELTTHGVIVLADDYEPEEFVASACACCDCGPGPRTAFYEALEVL
jgi:hypothetical protein